MKKLQILVPQYDEGVEVIRPLLSSLAIQQGIDLKDIGVIIANDGGPVGYTFDFLTSWPFDIEYLKCEHRGVSATRNACLDAATADYVMFCDADDMFFNACGLYMIFREMKGDGFNALVSVFVEESRNPKTKEIVYINHEMDSTFVHGKVYRRSFLTSNNIRWNDSLTVHEDSYFNCLAQKMTKDLKYCTVPFYLWKWRGGSVCRHDPKYILKTYNNMLESSTALVKELLRRGKEAEAMQYATGMIYDAYYTMNKDEWLNQENQEYRIKTERRFKRYFESFRALYDKMPKEAKAQLIVGIKNRFFQEGLLLESITFDDWIVHILAIE